MAIPDGGLSTVPITSPLLAPDNVARLSLLEDFERGGVALNDPTQGLDVFDWRCWTDGDTVWVARYPAAGAAAVVYEGEHITEVALAFDQNMRPTVALVEGGMLKLHWYDSLIMGMTTTNYPGARGPMLSLDDKRVLAAQTNDIIFAYVRGGNAYYRQQRERFGVEYLLGGTFGAARITQLGMGTNNRMQFKMDSVPPGRFTDLLTDALFVIDKGKLCAVESGDVEEAVWRSKTYMLNEQPSPGWARIEGDYPIRLRVIGDGWLAYTTPPITSPEPFRLPSQRWREWAFELVGATRVVEVAVASSREEL